LGDCASDAQYEAKALEAAAHGRLVPDAELASLSAKLDVGRGSQVASYGGEADSRSETRHGLEQIICERACLLWEWDVCPRGRATDYWQLAVDQRLRERA
jgi:hypothetical protein